MAVTDERTQSLVDECRRQAESCAYTSASLYVWAKYARWLRAAFLVAPIVFGGVATSQIMAPFGEKLGAVVSAFCSMVAGIFPAMFVALEMDMKLLGITQAAGEFTNLRDRFRQAAEVKSKGPFDEFNATFESLMDRMDALRAKAPPVPEWAFENAQKKFNKGDYAFAVDARSSKV